MTQALDLGLVCVAFLAVLWCSALAAQCVIMRRERLLLQAEAEHAPSSIVVQVLVLHPGGDVNIGRRL